MRNKLLRHGIIFAVIIALNIGVATTIGTRIVEQYRTASTKELEAIIGILKEGSGDTIANESAIMQILQNLGYLEECDKV